MIVQNPAASRIEHGHHSSKYENCDLHRGIERQREWAENYINFHHCKTRSLAKMMLVFSRVEEYNNSSILGARVEIRNKLLLSQDSTSTFLTPTILNPRLAANRAVFPQRWCLYGVHQHPAAFLQWLVHELL